MPDVLSWSGLACALAGGAGCEPLNGGGSRQGALYAHAGGELSSCNVWENLLVVRFV